MALARILAEPLGARLVLARVVPWEPLTLQAVPVPELRKRYEDQERAALDELQRAADAVGAGAEAGPGESPAQGLQLLADELEPDIVVLGSSHRGRAGRVLAGNVALRLLNGLDRPLAVAPAGYADRAEALRTIGVGFDGSRRVARRSADCGRAGAASGSRGSCDRRDRAACRPDPPPLGLRVGRGCRDRRTTTSATAGLARVGGRRPARRSRRTRPRSTTAGRRPCSPTARGSSICWCSARAATDRCAGCCSARSRAELVRACPVPGARGAATRPGPVGRIRPDPAEDAARVTPCPPTG